MGLTNNDIFKKLRVAHKLRDNDIVDICKLVDFKVSKSELGAEQIEKTEIYRPWDILQPQTDEAGQKIYHPFHDKGSIGVFLKGFFGYNSNPNIPEVVLWICALFFGLNMWRRFYF